MNQICEPHCEVTFVYGRCGEEGANDTETVEKTKSGSDEPRENLELSMSSTCG
jgi:hypothetical protein